MKKGILYALLTALGFSAGAACGYYAAQKRCKEECEKEIQEVRDTYIRMLDKASNDISKEVSEEINTSELVNPTKYRSSIDEYYEAHKEELNKDNAVKNTYNVFVNKYNGEDMDESKKDNVTGQKVGNDIYLISDDEIGDEDGFGIESFKYTADGILVDEGNEIVEDYTSFLGSALDLFEDEDRDYIDIRNYTRQCDYEIIRVLDKYSQLQ